MTYSIYVINLDNRSDRLSTSKSQLNAEALDFERISAVDGELLEENLFQTPNVQACWKSHVLAYKTFLKSESDYAVILEDDFHIKRKLDLSRNIEGWTSQEFDLLQIGFISIGIFNKIRWVFEELQKAVFRFVGLVAFLFQLDKLASRLRVREASGVNFSITVSSFFPGTHAYIISRKLASAIVNEGANNFSADEYFIALAKMRALRIGRLWRSRIGQNGSTPSISRRYVIEEKN
jgi:GR25 family glycosyltransferase involved in LPS biosynthesis